MFSGPGQGVLPVYISPGGGGAGLGEDFYFIIINVLSITDEFVKFFNQFRDFGGRSRIAFVFFFFLMAIGGCAGISFFHRNMLRITRISDLAQNMDFWEFLC